MVVTLEQVLTKSNLACPIRVNQDKVEMCPITKGTQHTFVVSLACCDCPLVAEADRSE